MKVVYPVQLPPKNINEGRPGPATDPAKLIDLTGPQRNSLIDRVQDPPSSPSFAITGVQNPQARVFVAHFDGTWNDMAAVPPGESETLVAKMFRESAASENPNIESLYVHGVGTRTRPTRVLYEGASGDGCEARAEGMHQALKEAVQRWLNEDPNVEVHVHAVGFSRGAATALHFLNLVHDRGASHDGEKHPKLAAGEVKSSAVLFDTVATGQEKVLKLTTPNTTVSLLHLTAQAEQRRHFQLTLLSDSRYTPRGDVTESLDNPEWAKAKGVAAQPDAEFSRDGVFSYQRIQEVNIAGARHSDVGGAYESGGMARIPQYLARTFQESLGIPGASPQRPMVHDIMQAKAHDSRDTLEIARQTVEGLFGKTSDLKNVNRARAKVQKKDWSGDIFRTVQAHMFDSNGLIEAHTFTFIVPHKLGTNKPTLQDLAKNKWVVITPDLALRKPGDGPMTSSTAGAFAMSKASDGSSQLTYLGERIDDAGQPNSIFDLMKKRPNGVHFSFDIVDQRMLCPMQTCDHAIPKNAKVRVADQVDAWPPEVISVIRSINARSYSDPSHKHKPAPITSDEANRLMLSAMEGTKQAIFAMNGQLTEVRIKVSSDARGNVVSRIAAYQDETIVADSRRRSIEGTDATLVKAQMSQLADGVTTVAELLKRSGFANFVSQAKFKADSTVTIEDEAVQPTRKMRP